MSFEEQDETDDARPAADRVMERPISAADLWNAPSIGRDRDLVDADSDDSILALMTQLTDGLIDIQNTGTGREPSSSTGAYDFDDRLDDNLDADFDSFAHGLGPQDEDTWQNVAESYDEADAYFDDELDDDFDSGTDDLGTDDLGNDDLGNDDLGDDDEAKDEPPGLDTGHPGSSDAAEPLQPERELHAVAPPEPRRDRWDPFGPEYEPERPSRADQTQAPASSAHLTATDAAVRRPLSARFIILTLAGLAITGVVAQRIAVPDRAANGRVQDAAPAVTGTPARAGIPTTPASMAQQSLTGMPPAAMQPPPAGVSPSVQPGAAVPGPAVPGAVSTCPPGGPGVIMVAVAGQGCQAVVP